MTDETTVPATDNGADERHRQRMVRKQAVMAERIAGASAEKGLLLVNTGTGKGKSTAAFGMLARTLGHGGEAGVVQFIKGRNSTGEERFFRRQPQVHWFVMGEGFSWDVQDKARERTAAAAAWEKACELMANRRLALVVLDELCTALKNGLLEVDTVLAGLQARVAGQHVVCTGRGAPDALLALADTATEMRLLKHAFQSGIKAMPGIEY